MYDETLTALFKNNESERDTNLFNYFFETVIFRELLDNQTNLVYGVKGSGKSALMAALTSAKHRDRYFSTLCINLKKLSFSQIYELLKDFNDLSNIEIERISNTVWKKTLVYYSLYSVYKLDNCPLKLRNTIQSVLQSFVFDPNETVNTVASGNFAPINAIQLLFHKIYHAPVGSKEDLKKSTLFQDRLLTTYYFDERIPTVLNDIYATFGAERKFLITMDGLDSIIEHSPISRQSVFSGLISAVNELRDDDLLTRQFNFSIFLPNELTFDSRTKLWDQDKAKNYTTHISWDKNELERFLQLRLQTVSRKTHHRFIDLWAEYFPDKVTNHSHGVDEDCLEYIFRHTLYRPRQVQDHIYNILKAWTKTGDPNKIKSAFIPAVVSKTNKQLSAETVGVLEHSIEGFTSFMSSFKNSSSIIELSFLRERVRKYLFRNNSSPNFLQVNQMVEELLKFGIFGVEEVLDANTPKLATNFAESKFKYFEFSFVGENNDTKFSSESMEDTKLVAFAPMFREYCELQNTQGQIVIPVERGRRFNYG